jgi:hypothetical protein
LNPKVAAAIGAIVGAFLMPSTWLLLVALTAGRAALDNLSGAADPAPAADPFEGIPDDPSLTAPEADAGLPGWLVALLVVAAVVTVLAALFFGWVGHTLATQRQRSRTADATAEPA